MTSHPASTGMAPVLERPGPPTAMGGMRAVEAAIEELQAFRAFVGKALKPGLDFGAIPNTGDKSTLLQPGAQKIAMLFNAYPDQAVQPHELGGGHVEYVVTTRLISRVSGQVIGAGLGSASTMESKYRWRKGQRTCPNCGSATVFHSRDDGGFFCGKRSGGCGANFRGDDHRITEQPTGRLENPDIHDARNTVLKIAAKRSFVSASMALGCASELFTQDLDDFADDQAEPREPARARKQEPRRQESQQRESRPSPGRELYNWAKGEGKRTGFDLIRYLDGWGKLQEFPGRMVDWDAGQAQLAREEAERKLAEPTQPQRPKQARTWDELVGRVLARWAELRPAADVKESEARRHRLVNGLGTRAIAEGKIAEGRVLKPAQAGKEPARDQGKLVDELRALFDREPKWLRAAANTYLNEKLGVPSPAAPGPKPAPPADPVDIPPLAPPPDAGDSWIADGDDLGRWAEQVEDQKGVPLNRFIAEVAAELGLSATWRDWTGEQVEDLHRRAAAHVLDTLSPPAE